MDSILLARHVETEKNIHDIHGASALDVITARGRHQADRLAATIRRQAPEVIGVVATATPQATTSAKLIAALLGLPYEGELALAPVDLGIASGRSATELRETSPSAHRMLDLFRARVTSGVDLHLPGAETAVQIETRLTAWWAAEGRVRCPGRLVVGSNSTVLMIAHLLDGVMPTDARYRYLAVPNGSARRWHRYGVGDGWSAESFPVRSWPDIDVSRVAGSDGEVAVTRHYPSWAPRRHMIVIVPGYFGSSRHGPYGLYNRLARSWAWHGFETVTIDPLGSGDSTPVFRDFASEVRSVEIVCGWLRREREAPLLLVGHSMGGATALRARDRAGHMDWTVWCLAPLCRMVDLARTFLDAQQLDSLRTTGRTFRHGLELRKDLIDESGAAWNAYCRDADAVWVAAADQYTADMDLAPIPNDRVHHIVGADHNFSTNESLPRLMESTTTLLNRLEEPTLGMAA
nr:alpha/beta fold hydrolase [Micromonospora sp. DSM 115978]